MRTMMKSSVIAAFLAILVLAVGCEDTALTPGEDFTMTLVARPSAVLVDAAHPSGQASIVASVYSATGVAQKGITVLFSSNGGTLTSGNSGVETDGNGNAVDTLTLDATSPNETTVVATSAALTQSVKVNKSSTPVNHAPLAVIVATPTTEQGVGQLVVFDGSTSTDPDTGDAIDNYNWVVDSSNPAAGQTDPFIQDGPASGVSFPGFVGAQTLTVTLKVTDHHGLVSLPVQKIYPIRDCTTNTAPVATIQEGDLSVHAAVGQLATVTLHGGLSTDADGSVREYLWTCGNGVSAQPPGTAAATVTCSYTVLPASTTYTASLVVRDNCNQTSTSDSVDITVSIP